MADIETLLQRVKTELEEKPLEEFTPIDKVMILLGAILLELRKP
jgi:hypothetical protein